MITSAQAPFAVMISARNPPCILCKVHGTRGQFVGRYLFHYQLAHHSLSLFQHILQFGEEGRLTIRTHAETLGSITTVRQVGNPDDERQDAKSKREASQDSGKVIHEIPPDRAG